MSTIHKTYNVQYMHIAHIVHVHVHEDEFYQKATEFQETSLKASHQCYVRMTCNTPTPGHPSVADEAWYW